LSDIIEIRRELAQFPLEILFKLAVKIALGQRPSHFDEVIDGISHFILLKAHGVIGDEQTPLVG
jgi:hypothetical protein